MKKTIIAGAIALTFTPSTFAAEKIELDDIVVTASRTPQKINDVLSDISVISAETIAKAGQTSLVDLLAMQPGIQISNSGGLGKSTSIFIRGANATHTLVLVDGMRINSATLGTTSLENIPLSQIERVEILRGPASSLYGADAIGGVIQIITKSGKGAPRFNASVGYGTYNTTIADGGVRGRIENTSFSLQAGLVKSDGVSAIANPKLANFNPDDDGYKNKNVSLKLAQHLSEQHEIGVQGFLSDGENHYDGGQTTPLGNPRNRFDFYGNQKLSTFDIYTKNQFADNWLSTLRFGVGTDDSDSYGPNTANTLSIKSVFKTKQQQWIWQNEVKTAVGQVLLGVERREQEVSGTTNYPIKERDIQSYLFGWQNSIDNHHLQLNVRSDDNSQFGNKTTGAASYAYQLSSDWRASISAGTGFNAPTFNQLYFPNFGNAKLRPEEAFNQEISVRYDNGTHKLGAVYYHNQVDDLIVFVAPTFLPANVSKAKLAGLTLTYQGSFEGFNLNANADFTQPEDEVTGKLLPRRSKNHGALNLSKAWGDWEAGTQLEAHSKRFDDVANTNKLAGYSLVNVYANYKINPSWSVNARVNNLLDRDYETADTYGVLGANAFVSIRYISAP